VIHFDGVSKWYGTILGLNKVTLAIQPGVTGLLGPNGAGKSTFLLLATGQLRPSQGSVRVLGQEVWNHAALLGRVGLCPEQDAFYEWMTGRQFMSACARLSGLSRRQAAEATGRVLEIVGMTADADRAIKGYSRGMRQRIKIGQALVHDPQVLFLDEPLTGTDPVARCELMDLIHQLGAAGKTIVVSSHVLHEVEAVTRQVVLLNHGRLVAQGRIREIRDLIDQHPHRIQLRSNRLRQLAARLVSFPDVVGVEVKQRNQAETESPAEAIIVQTNRPDLFYARLTALALEERDAPITEVYSEDDHLDAVFRYLVPGSSASG
jgi:ABC-2 type transport system ATP-binding protein